MNNDWVYLVCLGIPVLLVGGSLVGLFVMAVIEMGQGHLPPNSLNISDDPTWWGEEIKMKKIAWCVPFILVAMLSVACNGESSDPGSQPMPTRNAISVFTDNQAEISKYGGMGPEDTGDIQCPFTGRVVVTVSPDNHATIWVFGPDEIDGADNCKVVGDGELVRDDFIGTFNPDSSIVAVESCVGGKPGESSVVVTADIAHGNVSCRSKNLTGNGTHADISATFNAKLSK